MIGFGFNQAKHRLHIHHVINSAKSEAQGQRAPHFDAVWVSYYLDEVTCRSRRCRGLDNAGKTTIVKKILGEDVNTVSPTLGFNIKTIDYAGYDSLHSLFNSNMVEF